MDVVVCESRVAAATVSSSSAMKRRKGPERIVLF